MGTASVFDKAFRERRARDLARRSPRPDAKPVGDWAEAIGRDFPELVVRLDSGSGSPSPDGPLAIGSVSP